MHPTIAAVALTLLLSLACRADAEPAMTYAEQVAANKNLRTKLASSANAADVESEIIRTVETLASHWLGTTWGLGAPQTSTPQVGQINCGTFVGTVLRDAGFVVDVRKLQRQPSQLIIQSFVGGDRVRKYSNAPMKRFLASVRDMGPGLFIIGLDFHVGFLLQTENDLRFIHASYVTKTVVNESAASAVPIVSSKYRVVGKLLSPANVRAWLRGTRIKVKAIGRRR